MLIEKDRSFFRGLRYIWESSASESEAEASDSVSLIETSGISIAFDS